MDQSGLERVPGRHPAHGAAEWPGCTGKTHTADDGSSTDPTSPAARCRCATNNSVDDRSNDHSKGAAERNAAANPGTNTAAEDCDCSGSPFDTTRPAGRAQRTVGDNVENCCDANDSTCGCQVDAGRRRTDECDRLDQSFG